MGEERHHKPRTTQAAELHVHGVVKKINLNLVSNRMGYVKKALMEAECNAHLHPLFAHALSAFQPRLDPRDNPYKPATIYGLYANGVLMTTYLHKDTAEYECWVSRMGEEVSMAETPTQYDIRPLPMHTHRPD